MQAMSASVVSGDAWREPPTTSFAAATTSRAPGRGVWGICVCVAGGDTPSRPTCSRLYREGELGVVETHCPVSPPYHLVHRD
jgi:hypothetical protein